MSNVFNAPQARERILTILRKRAPSTENVESVFPPVFHGAPTDITRPKELSELLANTNLTRIQPRPVPDPIEVDVNDFDFFNKELTDLIEDDPDWLFKSIVEIPAGDTSFLPKYYPNHYARSYDLAFYKQCLYQATRDNTPGYTTVTMRDVDTACRSHAYGNGSYKGQVSRLKAMADIRFGLNGKYKPKSIFEQKFETFSQVSEILDWSLPIPPVNDHPGLKYHLSKYLLPDTTGQGDDLDFLPEINKKSIAGLPWIGDRKEKRVTDAILLGDICIEKLREIMRSPDQLTDEEGNLKKFFDEFPWFNMGLLFPKAERYDITEWETKTRNIWSSPFTTHLLTGMISSEPTKYSPNFLHADTPSMAHFSAAHGGLQEAISYLTNPGHQVLIYADNIYLTIEEPEGHHSYYSLDLEKGEANATPDKAQAVAYHLLTRGWIDEEGNPLFTPAWAFLASRIIPYSVVDPICVLMNQQFNFPGQGSGNSWTFLINHVISSILAFNLLNVYSPDDKMYEPRDSESLRQMRPSNDKDSRFQLFLSGLGINCKVELEHDNLEEELALAKQSPPMNSFISKNGLSQGSTHEYYECRLDILGWSAVYSTELETYVPTLDKARLIKSAALTRGLDESFQKEQSKSQDPRKTRARELLYLIAKNEAIILVGGHNDHLLTATCQTLSKSYKEKLRTLMDRFNLDTDEFDLTEELGKTEFGSELSGVTLNLNTEIEPATILALFRKKDTSQTASAIGATRLSTARLKLSEIANQPGRLSYAALKIRKPGQVRSKIASSNPVSLYTESQLTMDRYITASLQKLRDLYEKQTGPQKKKALEKLISHTQKYARLTEQMAKILSSEAAPPGQVQGTPLRLKAPENPLPELHLGHRFRVRQPTLGIEERPANLSRNARKRRNK
jgi:hypothetical protein